jgi:hypothetical protein
VVYVALDTQLAVSLVVAATFVAEKERWCSNLVKQVYVTPDNQLAASVVAPVAVSARWKRHFPSLAKQVSAALDGQLSVFASVAIAGSYPQRETLAFAALDEQHYLQQAKEPSHPSKTHHAPPPILH